MDTEEINDTSDLIKGHELKTTVEFMRITKVWSLMDLITDLFLYSENIIDLNFHFMCFFKLFRNRFLVNTQLIVFFMAHNNRYS